MESVSFTLPAETLDALRLIALRDGISLQQLLRAAAVKEMHHRGPMDPSGAPPAPPVAHGVLRLV